MEHLPEAGSLDALRDQLIDEQLKKRYLKDLLSLLQGLLLVAAEVVLLGPDLAVPRVAGLLEERLGKMGMKNPSRPDGPEGSQVPQAKM